ncbi:MAG: Card1-like endonuclease domain-containing protein [Gemmobacter sp.]
MTRTPAATWPDRFVYVCTATQGATVNHAPLHHAGAGRIAGLVILCAFGSPNSPSAQDRIQTQAPTERLRQTAMDAFGLPRDRIRVVTGHADLLAPWTDALHIAADMARREDAAIVFNITSGRKTATLGALLGAPRGPDAPEIVMVTVGLDSTLRRIDLLPDGRILERPLPSRPGLTLEVYLGTYGLRVIDPTAGRQTEARLADRTDAYAVLSHGLAQAEFRQRLGDLQTRVARCEGRAPWRLPLRGNEAAVLSSFLAVVEGVSVVDADLVLHNEDAQRFLSGLWLEGLALMALRSALSAHDMLHLARGVEVAGRRAPRGKAETDFDLALLHGNRFGLVECKAGRDARSVRRGLVHLSHYRALLAAQSGGAWLVAPLATLTEEEGLHAQVAALGVALLTGAGAVDQLVVAVQAWLSSPAARSQPGMEGANPLSGSGG